MSVRTIRFWSGRSGLASDRSSSAMSRCPTPRNASAISASDASRRQGLSIGRTTLNPPVSISFLAWKAPFLRSRRGGPGSNRCRLGTTPISTAASRARPIRSFTMWAPRRIMVSGRSSGEPRRRGSSLRPARVTPQPRLSPGKRAISRRVSRPTSGKSPSRCLSSVPMRDARIFGHSGNRLMNLCMMDHPDAGAGIENPPPVVAGRRVPHARGLLYRTLD